METQHGDIKVFSKDGKLKEIIPVERALERSFKDAMHPKKLGMTQRKKRKD